MLSWTGDLADPRMVLETFKGDEPVGALEGHSVITFNEKQNMAFLCDTRGSNSVVVYTIEDKAWVKSRAFEENKENILMLELSKVRMNFIFFFSFVHFGCILVQSLLLQKFHHVFSSFLKINYF